MPRASGEAPQFDRLMFNIERAKRLWEQGDRKTPDRLLKLVASIALAEVGERGPNDPIPE